MKKPEGHDWPKARRANPNDVHNFRLTQDQWEEAVFDNAAYFTTHLLLDRGRWDNRQFKTLPEALADARVRKGSYGRGCFINCVSEKGRNFTLRQQDYDRWLARWHDRHG